MSWFEKLKHKTKKPDKKEVKEVDDEYGDKSTDINSADVSELQSAEK